MFCERHYTAPVKGDGQFFSLGLSVPCHTKGLFPGHGRGRAFFLETIPETEQYYLTNMIFSPLLKKGVLLLALCGVLGGGVLSAQEAGGAPITEEGLKALDSNVFANEYMLALKPNVTRDRIARIKDPFVRGLATRMAEKPAPLRRNRMNRSRIWRNACVPSSTANLKIPPASFLRRGRTCCWSWGIPKVKS